MKSRPLNHFASHHRLFRFSCSCFEWSLLVTGLLVISSTMDFVSQSAVTNSAPRRCMAFRDVLPALSTKVSPVKSTRMSVCH